MPAPRNRTLTLSDEDRQRLGPRLRQLAGTAALHDLQDQILIQDNQTLWQWLPQQAFDCLFLDPPYNLTKQFGNQRFRADSPQAYQAYLESWLPQAVSLLKPGGSLYLCGDWRSAGPIQYVLDSLLTLQNRITFQREKGRGAKANWKNAHEDIWFATRGSQPAYFDVEAVKMKRKVLAPYRQDGQPKDWEAGADGNFRLSYPSNFWDDITIPFWSMPENTDHPTQKPEKLMARILLASVPPGGWVLDPFMGSGTTAAVARKLGRHFVGIEQERDYALLALRRLELANDDTRIQGYEDGVFWERNSAPMGRKPNESVVSAVPAQQPNLF